MRIECAIIALVLATGCRTDPEHPVGPGAVPPLTGPVVLTVNGRTVSAAEAAEFARTHEDATADGLVQRERRVADALEWGLDASLVRKRAMVQALLADEIEGKVGIDTVKPEDFEAERERVRATLRAPSGFHVASFRVGSIDLIQRRAELSPERIIELEKIVKDTADRLYSEVPDQDAIEAAEALTWEWVDPSVRVERMLDLRILDPVVQGEAPVGWVRSSAFTMDLEKLSDGEKTSLIDQAGVQMFAVRRARIDAPPTDEDLVTQVAEGRFLKEAREKRLNELLGKLSDRTTIVIHPELLEEGR